MRSTLCIMFKTHNYDVCELTHRSRVTIVCYYSDQYTLLDNTGRHDMGILKNFKGQ